MRNAKTFFQGLLRPFGARAIASQWSEPTARAQNTPLAECVHFQGPLRRCAPRAAFGGANRQHGHKIHSLRSVCTFRDYFVAALLVPPPSAGRTDSTGTKYTPCGVCALSQGLLRRCAPRAAASGGANQHPRTTVRSILFYRSDVVLPLKTQSKKMRNAEAFLIFLVHFQGLEPWAH